MTEIFFDALVASVGPVAAVYALAAIGLNLQFGYTGLLNFGHVGFMLAGGYGLAITVDAGGSFWLGLVVGVAAAIVLGALLGAPTLRLRADYLAIVTISAGEILRLVVRSRWAEPVTGGVHGLQQFAGAFFDLNPFDPTKRYGWGRFVFQGRQLWVLVVGWVLVALATALIWRLVTSPWGRALRGVREDEDAVRSLGKNVFMLKLQALILGGVIAAVAGMLRVVEFQNADNEAFLPKETFYLYVMVVLGGAGTLWGPVIGAITFQFLLFFFDGLMSEAHSRGWLPDGIDGTDAQQIKLVLVGIGLMVIMVVRPQGAFGKRTEQMMGSR
jgi:neutral amino acid transport system permease protein